MEKLYRSMDELIVVSGGTKGIGKAILGKFMSNGYPVATCSRNESELSVLKEELELKYKQVCHVKCADLSGKAGIGEFAEFILSIGIPVSCLVNNAGFFTPGNTYNEEEGALEAMIDSNLYSAYRLTRMLIPAMIDRKKGHIFNIGSIAAKGAYPNGGSYSISKFALQGFTENLRAETRELGIRVTVVNPGATYTPSWESSAIQEERLMPANDIAEAIYSAYCLSERSVVEEIVIRPQLGDV